MKLNTPTLGTYRVFFNHRNAPRSEIWVIDRGVAEKDEILVHTIQFFDIAAEGFVRLSSTPPEPKAFISLTAYLTIEKGDYGKIATFTSTPRIKKERKDSK